MSNDRLIASEGTKLRRTGRDSVFCDLFSQPEYLLELYHALHPEDRMTTETDLEIVSIEHVITDGEYNDLGFVVAGRLVVLVESQTTWSVNIVTRMLLYLAETYRRHIRNLGKSLHSSSLVPIPAPELYVVYTGKREIPEKLTFGNDVLGGEASALDLTIHVLRGDSPDVVGQYVSFASIFDEVRREEDVAMDDKPATVVRRCLEQGILVPYFERRRQEVEDIMFTLFDQEYETELYKKRIAEEAREQGIEQGIEQGKTAALAELVKDGVLALEDAASRLDVTPERFAELMTDCK